MAPDSRLEIPTAGDWGGKTPCGRSRQQGLFPGRQNSQSSSKEWVLVSLVHVWAAQGPTGSCWEDHQSAAEETSLQRQPGSQPEVALPVIREQTTAAKWSMEEGDLKTHSSPARGQVQCQPPIQEALILDDANSIPTRAFPPLSSPSSLCLWKDYKQLV